MSPTQLDEQGTVPFERRRQATVETLGDLRQDLSRWLEAAGASVQVRDAVVLAVHELVANAVEHSGSRAPVHVQVVRGHDHVRVEVSDGGRWRAAGEPGRGRGDQEPVRGRGLLLAARCLTSLEVVPGPTGTTVRGRAALG